jgi:hypothetical protein
MRRRGSRPRDRSEAVGPSVSPGVRRQACGFAPSSGQCDDATGTGCVGHADLERGLNPPGGSTFRNLLEKRSEQQVLQ